MEARDRITVLDYDLQGIEGFRDANMVVEVSSSIPVRVCYRPDNLHRPSQRTYNLSGRHSNQFLRL